MSVRTLLSRARRALGHRAPGHVEVFTQDRLIGWIAGVGDARKPVLLTLHVDGRHALNIAANRSRADVLDAGAGPLHCGFETSLPQVLRDGHDHLAEVRVGVDGPVLHGGRLRIKATVASLPATEVPDADAPATPATLAGRPLVQGVAWFDRRRAAIAGWAMNCGAVEIRLAGRSPLTLMLDREVPGLGGGSQQGFLLPVPPDLMDGDWHEAEVSFATGGTRLGDTRLSGTRLDGSPVRFRLTAQPPLVEIVSLVGPEILLRIRDAQGAPVDLPIALEVDGTRLDLRHNGRLLAATLPVLARALVLLDTSGEAEGTLPQVLARYGATGSGFVERPAFAPALPENALSPAGLAEAARLFVAFCAAPDRRFDPLWYGHSYPAAATIAAGKADDLIGHYAAIGAASGCSPGPFFDEAAARQLHPAAAQAIAAGLLPCAFALDLALGAGALGSLTAATPELARALATLPLQPDDPAEVLAQLLQRDGVILTQPGALADTAPADLVLARLPAPTALQSASDSIYTAWVARLVIDAETRAAIDSDEARFRQKIISTPLTRAPLVSIVMPSFNRAYTIGDAVQSVLDQSYPNWELLVCDDASEDKTPEVMRGFDDPRIRYMPFLKSNGAGTRNKGLRFARGEYIAYLDSDNIWHPLFLDLMLRQLMGNPGAAIAYCAYLDTEIVGAKVVLHKTSRAPYRQIQLSSRNFMDLNTIMHHRRDYDGLGGFDESLPRLQDWDLMLRYTSIFRPLFVDHSAVFYRRNVAWGQVTHLFTDSGAQNTVNDKTTRRLTRGHETLRLDWPHRGRVTVLVGGAAAGDRVVAASLAQLAAHATEVDLLDLTQLPASLQRDPYRLSHAMAQLLHDRPILSVGLGAKYLQAIPGLRPDLVYRLTMTAQGLSLRNLGDAAIRFHLGAVPLALPDLPPPVEATDGSEMSRMPPCALLIPPRKAYDALADLASIARSLRLALLIPPPDLEGTTWYLLSDGRIEPIDPAAGRLPDALARCTMAASLLPSADLSAFNFCLLNALHGRGVPLAIPRDAAGAVDGLADQWIEARAAYDVKVASPKWLFDKIAKLLADAQSHAALAERGMRVHQIALHPELAQERLHHLLYRLLFDVPRKETRHDGP